jgi:hypothetical protein
VGKGEKWGSKVAASPTLPGIAERIYLPLAGAKWHSNRGGQ